MGGAFEFKTAEKQIMASVADPGVEGNFLTASHECKHNACRADWRLGQLLHALYKLAECTLMKHPERNT